MPEVTLRIPAPLRDLIDGREAVRLEADSIDAVLSELTTRHPKLAGRLLGDDGRLRPYVNLFIGATDVRSLSAGQRRIDGPAELTVVPSIAGGQGLGREERLRYHRQLILPGLGAAGQQALSDAGVLVVGAGGLGSPAALYLAAAGVGRIGLVDSDRVELSNLHRQILHDTPSVGRPKTTSGRERLEALNPEVDVVEIPLRLNSDNAMEILRGWDVVLDGSDNFPTRYLVNDACVLLGIPLVFGAIYRFEGQASIFGAPGGPCYRCVFRDPPPAELVPSCAEAGVLGALPGIVGSLQASEAIKWITGLGTCLVGRLLLIDAATVEFRTLEIARATDCPVCGDNPTVTELVDYEEFCDDGAPLFEIPEEFLMPVPTPELRPLELKEMLDAGHSVQLVDIREVEEHEVSNLDEFGAMAIPMDQVARRLAEVPMDIDSVWFCRTGRRSGEVVEFLHSRGYVRALNLAGGINGWARDVDPDLPVY